MKSLAEPLSIEIWKTIAHQVQRISLPSRYYYDGYRVRNELKKLTNRLKELNIDIIEGYSKDDGPIEQKEAGLITLLEDICSITTSINYEQAAFFERIYKLDQIGIKTISYNPFSFPTSGYNLKGKSHQIGEEGIYITKNYTDGFFNYSSIKDNHEEKEVLTNLEDANFILEYGLIHSEEISLIRSAHATIKSFNKSDYPKLEEIMQPTFPENKKVIKPNRPANNLCYKQTYASIAADDIRDVIGYPNVREKVKYYYKKPRTK